MSSTVNGPLCEVLARLCMLLSRRGPSLAPVVFLKLSLAIGARSNSSDYAVDVECCLDWVDRLLYAEVRGYVTAWLAGLAELFSRRNDSLIKLDLCRLYRFATSWLA